MSIPVTEKVYIDSSILVSYALGEKDNRYHMAKRVFEEAMVGRYKIVISNFLLAETLQAIRGAVTRDTFKYLDDGLTHYRLIEIANSQEFKNTVMKKVKKRSLRSSIESQKTQVISQLNPLTKSIQGKYF